MFELLKKLRNGEAADRVELLARYRDILHAGDKATDAQVADLKKIMAALGYDSARVEADARAVTDRKRMKEIARLEPTRETKFRTLHQEHTALVESTEKEIKRLKDELIAHQQKTNAAETDFHGSRRAREKLKELERLNWELFGLDEPADAPRTFQPPQMGLTE